MRSEDAMLTRLLSNLDDIEACLLSGEGDVIGGSGEGNITIFHQAMKMATNLQRCRRGGRFATPFPVRMGVSLLLFH